MVIWTGDIGPKFLQLVLTSPSQKLLLSSPGGCVYSMLGAVDKIKADEERGEPWTVQGTGVIASAAILVLAAGGVGRRSCTPRTRFMIHPAGQEQHGPVSAKSLQTDADEIKLLDEQYVQALGAWTKASAERWQKLYAEGDYWFGAREALKLGLVDAILP